MLRISHIAAPAVIAAALFVGGCAAEHKDMPGNAQMMSEGKTTVAATAPHDGTVYIYDDSAHKNVYTGRVMKGDTVRVDAKENKVTLNDRPAVEKDLHSDHNFQIYFDRSENADAVNASHREGETVIQPNNGGATVYQPNGQSTTVLPPQQAQPIVPPAPSGNGATVVQPNGTVVQPSPNGGTTVTTPNGNRTTVEQR